MFFLIKLVFTYHI